uniref:Alginate lyase family protein n=1 Tax=Anaerolinea thermolimosa TaxID=229919 RepID=A0A7C4PIP9_9CHLR
MRHHEAQSHHSGRLPKCYEKALHIPDDVHTMNMQVVNVNGSTINFDLLFNTLRHLSWKQILYRFYYIVRKKWWTLIVKEAPVVEHRQFQADSPFLFTGLRDVTTSGPWEEEVVGACKRCEALAKWQFRFLNLTVSYPERIDWHDSGVSQLWRYQLHYFDCVQDLLVWWATGTETLAWEVFTSLVDSWIDGNRRLVGDGWHPFTISVRLVNWVHGLSTWKENFNAHSKFTGRYMGSLVGQARVLSSYLEKDVRGNHLLKNLRALLWAGTFFDSPLAKRWKHRALVLLQKELAEQILPDGGHFERTPGYHAIVLKDLLEIGLLLRHDPDAEIKYGWLDEALWRMLQYLCKIMPPDGRLPLLKDTAWDAAPSPCDLLAAGALYFQEPSFKLSGHFGLYPLLLFGRSGWDTFRQWPLTTVCTSLIRSLPPKVHGRFSCCGSVNVAEMFAVSLPETGYFVLRDDTAGDYLIFDAGKVCPEYLPAHAHADMLTYELTINHCRIVVDSGVFQYQAGKWRDYFRATRAHNTVEVENCNQSEVWGSFRVARRARPVRASCKRQGSCLILDVRHDGYRRLKVPVVHRRILVWESGRFWVIIDQLSGTGTVAAANYIHLAPAIQTTPIERHCWQLQGMPFPLWIHAFQSHESEVVQGRLEPSPQGWYSEQFGIMEPNTVLILKKCEPLPFFYGYIISMTESLRVKFTSTGNGSCDVQVSDDLHCIRIHVYPDEVKVAS